MFLQLNIKISLKLKSLITVTFFILINLLSSSVFAQNQKFKVVIDAGHGGRDPGTLGKASYKGSYESDVALKVVLQIKKLFQNNNEFQLIFTRKKNIFIPLHRRGAIANKADADLFISIHCNSAVTNAYGTTTYVLGVGKSAKNLELSKRENDVILLEDDYEKHYDYDPNSQEFIIGLTLMQEDYQDKSIEFAQIVQNKFVSVAKRKNRGVNQGNLAVLYDSYMPSVLIEIGFLTNKKEEKYLHSKNGQNSIAKSIYQAVKTYKRRIDANRIDQTISILENPVVQIDNTSNIIPEVISSNYYYTVQIATSHKKIETAPNNFKKLKNIERKKIGSVYKYYYGRTADLITAKKFRKKAASLGYKDAFVKRKKTTSTDNQITNTEIIDKKPIITIDSKPKVTENKPKKVVTNLGYYYSIQFATSRKKIPLKAYNFRGLKDVTRNKVGIVYKYLHGSTTDLNEARKLRLKLVKLGYKDAFVKKLKGNITVTSNEATTNTAIKTETNSTTVEGIIFKVQVASGKTKIETKSYNFKGLKDIERVQLGNFYKYYYGKTKLYTLISKKHKEAIAKGYKDAKIVAIRGTQLIDVNSVINQN